MGHIDFDTDGDGLSDPGARSVSDVWALGNFAYVGTYDRPTCSNHGVRIVDISDPSHPVQVANIQSPPNTRINDVKVIHIETQFLHPEASYLIWSIWKCNIEDPQMVLELNIHNQGIGPIALLVDEDVMDRKTIDLAYENWIRRISYVVDPYPSTSRFDTSCTWFIAMN